MTAVIGSIADEMSLVTAFSNEAAGAPLSSSFLSMNTIFTLMESGVGVLVGVADGFEVGVWLGMTVGEGVMDGVGDFTVVGVRVMVGVDVDVGTFVCVAEGVLVGVFEDVAVGPGV
jgi:hypothetical protein